VKKTYENFEEMANDFTSGEKSAHMLSDHSESICYIWQTSILEFAKSLDLAGIKLKEDSKIYVKFWDKMGETFTKWKAGYGNSCPESKKLGEMTRKEAELKYGTKIRGNKLIIPTYDPKIGKLGQIRHDYYQII
jgi:hypothetical protein